MDVISGSRFACLAAAAFLVFCGLPAQAEDLEAEDVVSYQSFVRENPYAQSVIAETTRLALSSIHEARLALDATHRERARRDTERAVRALKLVRNASPAARMEDGIGALHDRLVRGEGGNPQDLVPIYGDLEEYASLTEVADVREHLEKAKGRLGKGEFEEAAVALSQARAEINYVEIDLPVKETLAKLERALNEMRQNDWLAAEATLRDANNGVQVFAKVAAIEVDSELVDVSAGPN